MTKAFLLATGLISAAQIAPGGHQHPGVAITPVQPGLAMIADHRAVDGALAGDARAGAGIGAAKIAAPDEAVSFGPPARVCVHAEVDAALPALVGDRQDFELRSMKRGPPPFTSQITQALEESLVAARLPRQDESGARITRTYANEAQARSGCANLPNATYANAVISTNSSGRPYRITAFISQNGTTIMQRFERDAVPELDEFLRKQGPYVESQGAVPVRLGIGWSVDGDTRATMRRLVKRVTWRGIYD